MSTAAFNSELFVAPDIALAGKSGSGNASKDGGKEPAPPATHQDSGYSEAGWDGWCNQSALSQQQDLANRPVFHAFPDNHQY